MKAVGTWEFSIFLKFRTVNHPLFNKREYKFTLQVTKNAFGITNSAPFFESSLISGNYEVLNEYVIKLPSIKDPEDDAVTVEVIFDSSMRFSSYLDG